MKAVLAFALFATAVALLACGNGDAATVATCRAGEGEATSARPPAGNLFLNPGFEDGAEPWFSLDTEAWGKPCAVSQKHAHDGTNAALLQLRPEEGGGTRVFGVVQEIGPGEFPEVLSGYYYVDRWEKGTPLQYLQFVVIVDGADNIPEEVLALGANNHQLRYLLAGVDEQPTGIQNARYVFVGKEEPVVGEWAYFERNVRQDFQDLWGGVPRGFTKLRILFEVRWDDRREFDEPSGADVYYDDLYLGP